MSFQLTNISGKLPTLQDKNIHNFSLTKLGRKIKLSIQEPIETVIIRAEQNFEIVRGLNPIQIEIEDDRAVVNLPKKRKNVMYKLTPLGILFPASIKNNTAQVLITCRELHDVKKPLINSKTNGLFGIIDFKKLIIGKK